MINRTYVPNILSLLRIVLGCIVPVMLVYGGFYTRILAAILFFIAGLTDYFDGWYARKYNVVTAIGKILDPIADKIIILAGFFVLSSLTRLDVYSFWWVIPIFIREVLITIIRLVHVYKGTSLVMAARWSGKAKTILQFVTLPVAYFVFMFEEYGDTHSPWMDYILYAFLIASIIVTLHSGGRFLYKNWKHL